MMLIHPAAGARMAVGEAITNIVWAQISRLEDIKCSANWMWAPKLPGKVRPCTMRSPRWRDLMIQLGVRRWMAGKTASHGDPHWKRDRQISPGTW